LKCSIQPFLCEIGLVQGFHPRFPEQLAQLATLLSGPFKADNALVMLVEERDWWSVIVGVGIESSGQSRRLSLLAIGFEKHCSDIKTLTLFAESHC
jgi:hypothetical protein